MRMLTIQNVTNNTSSCAAGLVVGYAVTKGFVISPASAVIFVLFGNISLVLAVGLTFVTLVRIRVMPLHVVVTLLLASQALYVFMIGYVDYEYFIIRYALYVIQMLIVLIAVFSKNFSIRVFTGVVVGVYLLSAVVLLGTGVSFTMAASAGSLVKTGADTLNNYQALAHVFGVCATIFAVIALRRGSGSWLRVWFAGPALGFLVLAFFSGGRGELIASVFMILISFSQSHLLIKLVMLTTIISAQIYYDVINELQQSAGYTRILYAIENKDSGMRVQLFLEGFQAYGDGNIFQIFFGQGVNAFQHTYNYAWGFYPHNFLIEMLLTSGLLLFLFYLLLYINIVLGLFAQAGRDSVWNSLFFMVGCNYLVLTMKSGTISTSSAGLAFLFIAWFRPEMRSLKLWRSAPVQLNTRNAQ